MKPMVSTMAACFLTVAWASALCFVSVDSAFAKRTYSGRDLICPATPRTLPIAFASVGSLIFFLLMSLASIHLCLAAVSFAFLIPLHLEFCSAELP
jgi:hypothetical protein